MIDIGAIPPVGLDAQGPQINRLGVDLPANPLREPVPNFQSVLSAGIESMDKKLAHADDMVKQFALDDNVPVHQVTIALEEAKFSVELAMQVRARLIEGYRELMNMQL